MLGIAIPPLVPAGEDGTGGTIVAILTSAALLIGVVIWVWTMVRHGPTVGTTVELPARETRKAA